MKIEQWAERERARKVAMCEAAGLDPDRVIDVKWSAARPKEWRFTVLDDGEAGEVHHQQHDEWRPVPEGWGA